MGTLGTRAGKKALRSTREHALYDLETFRLTVAGARVGRPPQRLALSSEIKKKPAIFAYFPVLFK